MPSIKRRFIWNSFRRLNKEWSVAKSISICPPVSDPYRTVSRPENIRRHLRTGQSLHSTRAVSSVGEKDENGLGSKVKKEIEEFVEAWAIQTHGLQIISQKVEWLIDAQTVEKHWMTSRFSRQCDSARKVNPDSIVEGICCHTDMGVGSVMSVYLRISGRETRDLVHQADEFIEIEELLTCTKMIASIMDWCGAEEIHKRRE